LGSALFLDFMPGDVVLGLLVNDPAGAAGGVDRPVKGGTFGERCEGERVAGAGEGRIFSLEVVVTTGGGTEAAVELPPSVGASTATAAGTGVASAGVIGAAFIPAITAEEEGVRFRTGDFRR
jgi:hypothetical protein